MSALNYTTINGSIDGRASYFFRSAENAKTVCEDQNVRAVAMHIKARYQVATCPEGEVDARTSVIK